MGVIRFHAHRSIAAASFNQAIVCAEKTTGLVHHSNHGSHYVSVVYNEQLSQHGISVCLGTVGDSYKYNKALAEKRSRFLQKRAQLIPERKATLSRWKSPR